MFTFCPTGALPANLNNRNLCLARAREPPRPAVTATPIPANGNIDMGALGKKTGSQIVAQRAAVTLMERP